MDNNVAINMPCSQIKENSEVDYKLCGAETENQYGDIVKRALRFSSTDTWLFDNH